MRLLLTGLVLLSCCTAPAWAAEPAAPRKLEKGSFRFEPMDKQQKVPERYRLQPGKYDYELEFDKALASAKIDRFKLRFPSPVETDCKENNTVHAEYYRPRGKDKFPCVIVLDITAGNQDLSRTISTVLSQNGIGALFVQMAYYGPRRPPGSRRRLLTPNIPEALDAVRQTVLDLRVATAWMASRPEIDKERLGIMGTSLGSFMAALTAEMEPRLGRCAVLLGGGNLVANYYHDPRGNLFVSAWEYFGGSEESMKALIAPADPITCAANLKERKLLIMAAKRDEIVPPQSAQDLYDASGKQKLVWFDCGHYTAAFYFVPAMRHLVEHFGD